tara:strand:- start:287 stop:511 length:225 start_codon:yes stop_codon:yes gene_type:complete
MNEMEEVNGGLIPYLGGTMYMVVGWIVLAVLALIGIIFLVLLAVPPEYFIVVYNINIVSVLLGVVLGKIYSYSK